MNKLTPYLEQYALLSLEKQEKLIRLVNEHTSELDLDSGKIIFDNRLELPFQMLGTESDNTLTWLWAWAEEQDEIAGYLLKSALLLKEWGIREGIQEFMLPSIDLDRADGNEISLIASEICNAGCFYRSSYEGGAVFVLLFGDTISRQEPFDSAALFRQFSDLTGLYELNHRRTLLSYLRAKRLGFSESGSSVVGGFSSGEKFNAEFDGHDRLVRINGREVEQKA